MSEGQADLNPRLVEIGQRIRNRRDDLDYSQEFLAEQVGLTRGSISNLEAGRQHPPLLTFLEIAKALHIHPADLLAGVPGDPTPPARLDASERAGLEGMRRTIDRMLARER
jgi:transcriptional regulator with XRE-family HTH domain